MSSDWSRDGGGLRRGEAIHWEDELLRFTKASTDTDTEAGKHKEGGSCGKPRRPGFLNFGIDILDQIIFFLGGCPVHCKIFSNIPDLYPLGANSTSHPAPLL